MRGDGHAQRKHSLVALRNLAYDSEENQTAIARAGGIEHLLALAQGGTETEKKYAAATLSNLAMADDVEVAIVRAGGVKPLVALVRDGTDAQKEHGVVALMNLAFSDESKRAIVDAGGIPPLVTIANRRDLADTYMSKCAGGALRNLADSHDEMRIAIAAAGYVFGV